MIGKVYAQSPNAISMRRDIYKVTKMVTEYSIRISTFDYENKKWKDLTSVDSRTFEGWFILRDSIGKRLVRR